MRDEGRAYADRLGDAGVQVTYRSYPGVIHGFFWMAGAIHEARQLLGRIADDLTTLGITTAVIDRKE